MDLKNIDPKLVAAFLELVKAQGAAPAPVEPAITFADIWKPYSTWGKANLPSWRSCQACQEKHLLPFWGHRPWHECGFSAADEFVALRKTQVSVIRKTTVANATINRELATIKAAMNWALRRPDLGVKHNPLARYEMLAEFNDRDFHLSEAEMVRLLNHCRPLLRLMLILAFETGMRKTEFRELEWSEVDLENGIINMPAERTKTKRARAIPLSDVALRVLRTAQIPGVRWVFPSPGDADKTVSSSTLGKWFQDARDKAGIRGPKGQDVWIHSIRKSSVTLNAIAGMDLQSNMDMHGHTSKSVHDHYRMLTPEYLQKAREALNRRRGPVQAPPTPPPPTDTAAVAAKESAFLAFLRPAKSR